jgi:hypothetical protein
MLNPVTLLLLGAFVLTLVSAAGKCPLWVPVLLVILALLLGPLGIR